MSKDVASPPSEKQNSLQFVTFLAAAVLLAALAAYAWLGTCSRLTDDDYAWASGNWTDAIFDIVSPYLNSWGRYSSTFLLGLLMPLTPKVEEWLPGAVVGLWLMALLMLFRGLLANRAVGWSLSLLAAAATLWATLDSTLSIGQSLYWPSAMMTFTAPLVMLTFIVALMIAFVRAERVPGWLACTWMALLVSFCSGFSETTLALQAGIAGMALLWARTHPGNPSLRRIAAVSFIATLISGLVVILSPGNAHRLRVYSSPAKPVPALMQALWLSMLWTARFFLWKPAAAVSIFAAGWLVARWIPSKNDRETIWRRMILGLFATGTLLTMSFLPAAYSIKFFPPSRVLIVPQFVLVLAVFGCGCIAAAVADPRMGTLAVRSFQLLICTVLIGAPLGSLYETFRLHADAARYAKLWDRRDQRLRAMRFHVVLDPLPKDLAIPGMGDLKHTEIAAFYGFSSVSYSQAEYWPEESWMRESWMQLTTPEAIPQVLRGTDATVQKTLHDTLRPMVPEPIVHLVRKIRKL
jgi:hypothetical protein